MKLISILLLFVGATAFAQTLEPEFSENPELLQRILTEGSTQRNFSAEIKILKLHLTNFDELPNSWIEATLFRIYDQEGNRFKFEGIRKGAFFEALFCKNYEIRFSGSYFEADFPSSFIGPKNWMVGDIKTTYTGEQRCL